MSKNVLQLCPKSTCKKQDYIEDAIILDGDQVIYNTAILSRNYKCSGYNSVWTNDHTDEWLMTVEDGVITSCSRAGGNRGWQLYSISRWTKSDGQKLKRHIEIEFIEKKNLGIYWDDVALFCYPGEYKLGIYEMSAGDVVEVDSLVEFAEVDSSYRKFINGGVYITRTILNDSISTFYTIEKTCTVSKKYKVPVLVINSNEISNIMSKLGYGLSLDLYLNDYAYNFKKFPKPYNEVEYRNLIYKNNKFLARRI